MQVEIIKEEFKQIEGYENYSISNLGNVKNDKTDRILKQKFSTNGYKIVQLYKNGKASTNSIHRLIAQAYIPNPDHKQCVDHINNDRTDNRLENLRYATKQENSRNCSISKNNTSGTKGVNWNKRDKKWSARITIDGIKIHIGRFDNKEDAINARVNKANEVFGIYTNECEKVH